MKRSLFSLVFLFVLTLSYAQQVIQLPKPNLDRKSSSVMKIFQQRRSVREYSSKDLTKQDLSDLLWAAQGVNREDGRLTSPTCLNKQEIKLYVFDKTQVSLYEPKSHTLSKVSDGDHRDIVDGGQGFAKTAPVILLMVADMDKFGSNNEGSKCMTSVDVGIVCQNINIFCAAANLNTVPRASMNHAEIKKLLKLTDNQKTVMNNPVGYPVNVK